MLLDVTKEQATKLKQLINNTEAVGDIKKDFSIVFVSSSSFNIGDNVTISPIYADKINGLIVFSAEAIASYSSDKMTGVIASNKGEGKRSLFIPPLSLQSGYIYDGDINENWAIIKNNGYSIGNNLSRQLIVTSSDDYWRVVGVFNDIAVIKNNSSGGGGGGGSSQSITFFNDVTVVETSSEIVFTLQSQTISVLVP